MPDATDLRIPVDEDEGIELRVLQPDDAERLYELVDANREHLARWLPWAEGARLEHERAFIDRNLAALEAGEGVTLGIVVEGQLVGGVGVPREQPLNRMAEVGYWLAEAWTGRGIMTRAVRALTTHLVEDAGMHRIVIRVAEENEASWRIPERLGFELESREREAILAGGRFHDARVYVVLEDRWRELEAVRQG